ncbi:hypothetical protein ACLOJK_025947 [Asimina triloba]
MTQRGRRLPSDASPTSSRRTTCNGLRRRPSSLSHTRQWGLPHPSQSISTFVLEDATFDTLVHAGLVVREKKRARGTWSKEEKTTSERYCVPRFFYFAPMLRLLLVKVVSLKMWQDEHENHHPRGTQVVTVDDSPQKGFNGSEA